MNRRSALASLAALSLAPASLADIVKREAEQMSAAEFDEFMKLSLDEKLAHALKRNPSFTEKGREEVRRAMSLAYPGRAVKKEHGIRLSAGGAGSRYVAYATLDGDPIGDCEFADEMAGVMHVYLTDGKGNVLLNKEKDELNRVAIYGDVKFVMLRDAPSGSHKGNTKMRYLYAENGLLKLSEAR